jgi:hypothetical protein
MGEITQNPPQLGRIDWFVKFYKNVVIGVANPLGPFIVSKNLKQSRPTDVDLVSF